MNLNNSNFTRTLQRAVLGFMAFGLVISAVGQSTNLDFPAIQSAADAGQAKAQYEVAECYAAGRGVEKDDRKAAQYLQKAAQQADTDAEIALGALYGQGRGVPRSLAMALHWYQKAAEQGNPLAQYAMGNFYAIGKGVANDMPIAIKWWRKAASQNQPDAEHALGKLFAFPDPVYGTNFLNYPEGIRLLRLAAGQGNVPAMNDLGAAYENGLAVKLNPKESAKWYRLAADRGDALAQANLGQLYFDGRGVPFDLEQAYKWFKLSSLQGEILGIKGFANFQNYKLLTPKQLAEAEQMVADYKPISVPSQP